MTVTDDGLKREHSCLSPCQRAKRWYLAELAIAGGSLHGRNEFAPYVPVEARVLTATLRAKGFVPRFTCRHFRLWAALTEITGKKEFKEPFQWSKEDVGKHLLGFNVDVPAITA